ncbi:MAG: hypothetical protein KBF93_14935 [Leptospiraceae bacterium]|nr:hypothetical protein [Leptospiraceae bacterium]
MKRYLLSKFSVVVILLFLFSCFPPFEEKEKEDPTPTLVAALLLLSNSNQCNGLWAIDFNTGLYSCQAVTLVASGTNIEIYEQRGLAAEKNYASSNFKYANVVSAFENTIHPKITTAFGNPTDIDGNKKITLFVLDIGFGIGGYVDPVQFFEDSPDYPDFRSNQKEILYIDGNALLALRKKEIAVNLPDTFLSTIAHEYQHLIRFQHELGFSRLIRTFDDITNKTFTFDDTWINEGTSEVASDIAGYGPQYSRMACFRGDPATDCVEGAAGYSLFNWRSSIRNYASAYTFMSYLYNNAGKSESEQIAFIKNTVVGNSSKLRGNTISNMMTLFQSAAKYDSTLLTSDTTGMFRRLYATFLSLAFNPSRYPTTSTLYIGTSNIGTMESLQTTYPLPSSLNPIYTYASNFGVVKGSTFLMDPSAFYRVSENSSTAPSNADTVKVWNGSPAAYGSEFIVFNGRIDTTPVLTNAKPTDKENFNNEILKWETPITKTGELFCPHSFITRNHSFQNNGTNIKERMLHLKTKFKRE